MAGKTEIQRALSALNYVASRGYDTEYTRKQLEGLLSDNQELYLDDYSAQYKIRDKNDTCQTEIQRLREVVRGLQDELSRYQIIARNAIIMWEQDASFDYHYEDFKQRVLDELGINETEYYIIMED